MARTSSAGGKLWRYNYKVLFGTGYWILFLPVAASQVVTLWMMALSGEFSQEAGNRIAEMMTPILGAFLVAHSLAPEYRSGIGAVLASKPVSLHRVVTMRVGLAMLLAIGLTLVTMVVCSVGLKPIDIVRPMLASLPSLFFLSLVALTLATLFRNSLAGFAAAAGLWALDMVVGYDVHPLLSLQGYHAIEEQDPLAGLWVAGKITLLVVAVALLFLHRRLIPRICRPPERQDIVRITAVVASVLLAYCLSGAAVMVGFAYQNRAHLDRGDVVWLQRQLRNYGPVPVALFFGPAFGAYVAQAPVNAAEVPAVATSTGSDLTVPTPSGTGRSASIRVVALEKALTRWPRSMWADGIAFALAEEQDKLDPQAAAPRYRLVAERFPTSPFAPKALARIIRADPRRIADEDRLNAARSLVKSFPEAPEVDTAAELLRERYSDGTVTREEMLDAALKAARSGLRFRRPNWLMIAAGLQDELGRKQEAIASAKAARELGLQLQMEARQSAEQTMQITPHLPRIGYSIGEAEKLLRKLGAR
jgi:hypothetical protein